MSFELISLSVSTKCCDESVSIFIALKHESLNKVNTCSQSSQWRMGVKINEQVHYDANDLREGRAACE